MLSKNLKIGIGVLFTLFILFGCLGSGASNDNQGKTIEKTEVAAKPVQTTAAPAAQNQNQNNDIEWLRTSGNWYIVIGQDMTSVSQAASSGDLDSLLKYAKQARGNINNAIKSDSEYSPSAKYNYAHSEYLNSLEDMGTAMDLIISCGNEGWTDSQKITEATKIMNSGTVHVNNFSSAIKTV